MTEHVNIHVLGLRTRIELGNNLDDGHRLQVRQAWSGALIDEDGETDITVPITAGADFARAMERLTVDVTLAALDALRGQALMFHAAGVADEEGRVVAFVGPSGRGKTTLSRELGRRWGYVSDETVAVHPGRNVSAYRKPLSVVRSIQPKQQMSPQEAGLRALPKKDLQLAALVLIERDAEADGPAITPMPLAEALPLLVPQMSYLRDQDKPLQTIASLVDAIGGIQRLRYREAETVGDVMPQLFSLTAQTPSWSVPNITDSGPVVADVDDAIVADGFVIVMAAGAVHVLDGIAPMVWTACAHGDDLTRVVDAVVAEFGDPPEGDPVTAVEGVIEQLVTAGLLRRR